MQEYQYDNNQSSSNFSFQANEVNTTGTPSARNSSQPVYTQNNYNMKNEDTTGSLFRKIVGSGLISISVIIAICLVAVSIAGFMKTDEPEVNTVDYDTVIEQMADKHDVFAQYDAFFEEGRIDEMYEMYVSQRSDVEFYTYKRASFLYILDDYSNANNYYDQYMTRDDDQSYLLAAFLYYNFQFILTPEYYSYEFLDSEERAIIDEKVEEVKERMKEALQMDDENLYNYINSFRSNESKYVDYSAISEFAKELYGEN